MPVSFIWSAQVCFRRLCSSSDSAFFFRFQGLAHAVEGADRLLVVASLDVTPVLVVVVVVFVVVVAVVIVILLADDEVPFLHAPALTSTATLAVVALFRFALGFLSSNFSICRLLDERELAMVFLLYALKRPKRFLERFLSLHFLYNLQLRFGVYHQPMWMKLTMFDFHDPFCALTA